MCTSYNYILATFAMTTTKTICMAWSKTYSLAGVNNRLL